MSNPGPPGEAGLVCVSAVLLALLTVYAPREQPAASGLWLERGPDGLWWPQQPSNLQRVRVRVSGPGPGPAEGTVGRRSCSWFTCVRVWATNRHAVHKQEAATLLQALQGALWVWLLGRADSEHRFWKPSEVEGEVDNSDVCELLRSRHITFAGRFEPVQHHCRARRPDGRLCQRQDRLKVRLWARPGCGCDCPVGTVERRSPWGTGSSSWPEAPQPSSSELHLGVSRPRLGASTGVLWCHEGWSLSSRSPWCPVGTPCMGGSRVREIAADKCTRGPRPFFILTFSSTGG